MTGLYFRRAAGAALALSLAALVGCGGGGTKRASVEGTVTYDGKPIDNGSITFVPDGGGDRPKAGGSIKDGKYSIGAGEGGPVPGKYKVEITWDKSVGKKLDPDIQGGANTKQVLPDKFNKATTLTAEVKSGTNTIDFPLTK
jgi:hypothetical protein